jgi:hypothetical protein
MFGVRWRSADLLEIFVIRIFISFFLWVCLFISAIRSISTFATPPPTDKCEKRQAEICDLILFFRFPRRLGCTLHWILWTKILKGKNDSLASSQNWQVGD